MNKLGKLKTILKDMGSVLLAYSGGADSTFLLKVARDVLKNRVLAVTAKSPTYPKEELIFSKNTARMYGVKHRIINTLELRNNKFSSNPINRCYFCKKELFAKLKKIARQEKLNFVIDASNISDKDDFRPGSKAKNELNVRSPLAEVGLSKNDIRKISKKLGIVTWDKPSLACLASRVPYGTKIYPVILKRINRAERFLRKLDFKQVRLRHYNGLCRIEVMKQDIPRLINKAQPIIDKFKKLGYNYITVDLEGYRSGSMNLAVQERQEGNLRLE
ncbi:MAG: ATP-dependent sacrificial sulfur transferase LarE [Candidatus Omnitrophica bacterium]|nr:ATP-dependent sacrificial sulfur transferase LarE [Candidatus Omnitrophota bacterium]